MPRQTQTHISNFPSFKKIAIGFIVLAAILLIFIVYFSFAKATITLELNDEPKSFTFDMSVTPTSTESDLLGEIIAEEVEIKKDFDVKNFREEPGVATGKIKIVNEKSTSQALIKTTRFLSAEGALFRLTNGVTVPAGGEIIADVYADEKGETFNIGPTKFTIPGLSESLQKQVYGTSDSAMTGGIKKIGVLTQTDIDTAKNEMKENLINLAKEKLQEMYKDKEFDENLINVEIENTEISDEVGDEISGFSINAKVLVQAVIVNKDDLIEVAQEKYKEKNTSGETITSWMLDDMEYKITSVNEDKNEANLEVKMTAQVSGTFDAEKFDKSEIAGFDKTGVEYYFSQFPGVKSVDVKFWPFWVKGAPALADRIEVEFK